MKKMLKLIAVLSAALMFLSFAGCKKEGPAEKAGKEMDKAVEEAKKIFDK